LSGDHANRAAVMFHEIRARPCFLRVKHWDKFGGLYFVAREKSGTGTNFGLAVAALD
jgi:hypothetical protein